MNKSAVEAGYTFQVCGITQTRTCFLLERVREDSSLFKFYSDESETLWNKLLMKV